VCIKERGSIFDVEEKAWHCRRPIGTLPKNPTTALASCSPLNESKVPRILWAPTGGTLAERKPGTRGPYKKRAALDGEEFAQHRISRLLCRRCQGGPPTVLNSAWGK
jgi:hypothetical protein